MDFDDDEYQEVPDEPLTPTLEDSVDREEEEKKRLIARAVNEGTDPLRDFRGNPNFRYIKNLMYRVNTRVPLINETTHSTVLAIKGEITDKHGFYTGERKSNKYGFRAGDNEGKLDVADKWLALHKEASKKGVSEPKKVKTDVYGNVIPEGGIEGHSRVEGENKNLQSELEGAPPSWKLQLERIQHLDFGVQAGIQHLLLTRGNHNLYHLGGLDREIKELVEGFGSVIGMDIREFGEKIKLDPSVRLPKDKRLIKEAVSVIGKMAYEYEHKGVGERLPHHFAIPHGVKDVYATKRINQVQEELEFIGTESRNLAKKLLDPRLTPDQERYGIALHAMQERVLGTLLGTPSHPNSSKAIVEQIIDISRETLMQGAAASVGGTALNRLEAEVEHLHLFQLEAEERTARIYGQTSEGLPTTTTKTRYSIGAKKIKREWGTGNKVFKLRYQDNPRFFERWSRLYGVSEEEVERKKEELRKERFAYLRDLPNVANTIHGRREHDRTIPKKDRKNLTDEQKELDKIRQQNVTAETLAGVTKLAELVNKHALTHQDESGDMVRTLRPWSKLSVKGEQILQYDANNQAALYDHDRGEHTWESEEEPSDNKLGALTYTSLDGMQSRVLRGRVRRYNRKGWDEEIGIQARINAAVGIPSDDIVTSYPERFFDPVKGWFRTRTVTVSGNREVEVHPSLLNKPTGIWSSTPIETNRITSGGELVEGEKAPYFSSEPFLPHEEGWYYPTTISSYEIEKARVSGYNKDYLDSKPMASGVGKSGDELHGGKPLSRGATFSEKYIELQGYGLNDDDIAIAINEGMDVTELKYLNSYNPPKVEPATFDPNFPYDQKSAGWLKQRMGKQTASQVKGILSKGGIERAAIRMAEEMQGKKKELRDTAHMRSGRDLEDKAVAVFLANQGKDFRLEEAYFESGLQLAKPDWEGFVGPPRSIRNIPSSGVTPDGSLYNKVPKNFVGPQKRVGLLEVKALEPHKVESALDDYMRQLQFQLAVTGEDVVHFLALNKVTGHYSYHRVEADPIMQKVLIERTEAAYNEALRMLEDPERFEMNRKNMAEGTGSEKVDMDELYEESVGAFIAPEVDDVGQTSSFNATTVRNMLKSAYRSRRSSAARVPDWITKYLKDRGVGKYSSGRLAELGNAIEKTLSKKIMKDGDSFDPSDKRSTFYKELRDKRVQQFEDSEKLIKAKEAEAKASKAVSKANRDSIKMLRNFQRTIRNTSRVMIGLGGIVSASNNTANMNRLGARSVGLTSLQRRSLLYGLTGQNQENSNFMTKEQSEVVLKQLSAQKFALRSTAGIPMALEMRRNISLSRPNIQRHFQENGQPDYNLLRNMNETQLAKYWYSQMNDPNLTQADRADIATNIANIPYLAQIPKNEDLTIFDAGSKYNPSNIVQPDRNVETVAGIHARADQKVTTTSENLFGQGNDPHSFWRNTGALLDSVVNQHPALAHIAGDIIGIGGLKLGWSGLKWIAGAGRGSKVAASSVAEGIASEGMASKFLRSTGRLATRFAPQAALYSAGYMIGEHADKAEKGSADRIISEILADASKGGAMMAAAAAVPSFGLGIPEGYAIGALGGTLYGTGKELLDMVTPSNKIGNVVSHTKVEDKNHVTSNVVVTNYITKDSAKTDVNNNGDLTTNMQTGLTTE